MDFPEMIRLMQNFWMCLGTDSHKLSSQTETVRHLILIIYELSNIH